MMLSSIETNVHTMCICTKLSWSVLAIRSDGECNGYVPFFDTSLHPRVRHNNKRRCSNPIHCAHPQQLRGHIAANTLGYVGTISVTLLAMNSQNRTTNDKWPMAPINLPPLKKRAQKLTNLPWCWDSLESWVFTFWP